MSLAIKDPTYAAFILSMGHELEEVEPSTRNSPKLYLFNESVKEAGLGDLFYGVTQDAAEISWVELAAQIKRLYRLEDTMLRNESNRPDRSCIETTREEPPSDVFVTTVQVVAAYLLKNEQKIQSVDPIGINFGHLWRFYNAKECQELFVKFNNNGNPERWFAIKMWMKYATSVRNELNRNKLP